MAIADQFPEKGQSSETVLERIRLAQEGDADWHRGRTWKFVYHANDPLKELVQSAYLAGFAINGLGGLTSFPSLGSMERSIIGMCSDLFAGSASAGSVTSGGSESNFLAVKAARDRARKVKPRVTEPEMVVASSIHPSFGKAAHVLGVREIQVPVSGITQRADADAMAAAVTKNTVLIVGSAPSYWFGVVDPIPDLGEIARRHEISLHVDSCIGGFVLPFARDLGFSVPRFDFSVAGVSSLSADIHKFGYGPKGSSVILYASDELYQFQPTPVGTYNTPNLTGTRPGGSITGAWAVITHLGRSGYLGLVEQSQRATRLLLDGLPQCRGIDIPVEPDPTSILAFSCASDIRELANGLLTAGWHIGYEESPIPSIHLTVTASHLEFIDDFLRDVASGVMHSTGTARGI